MEEVWNANMYKLLRWAIYKGLENAYPSAITRDEMLNKLKDLTEEAFWEGISDGSIECYFKD